MTRAILALAALLPAATRAADPERGPYLAASGALRTLPALSSWVFLGRSGAVEFGWREPTWCAGLLLAATAHNVVHYEIQAEDPGAPRIGGDLLAARAGVVGRHRLWGARAVALDLRAEAGFSYWSTPIPEVAWAEEVRPLLGRDAQRQAFGAWAALGPGLDLTLPVLDEGRAQPRALFELLAGWQQAGNLSGLDITGAFTLVAPL